MPTYLLILPIAFVAFLLSASAGMGGSLILIPALALLFGGKQAIVLGSLLLACNNIAKVIAYLKTIPIGKSAILIVATSIGAYLGASLLSAAPEWLVDGAVAVSICVAFCYEFRRCQQPESNLDSIKLAPGLLALFAGASSGFSGTSGPLKGIALKTQGFNRIQLVSAAAAVSLFGDLTKVLAFTQSGFYDSSNVRLTLAAIPLMAVAAWLGRRFNNRVGERIFGVLFWAVMLGYLVRLFLVGER